MISFKNEQSQTTLGDEVISSESSFDLNNTDSDQSQSSGSNVSSAVYRGQESQFKEVNDSRPQVQVQSPVIQPQDIQHQKQILDNLSSQNYQQLKLLQANFNLQNQKEESKQYEPELPRENEQFIAVQQDSNSLFRCLAFISLRNESQFQQVKLEILQIFDQYKDQLVDNIFDIDEFNRLQQIVNDQGYRGELIHALLYCRKNDYSLKIRYSNIDHDLCFNQYRYKNKVWLNILPSEYQVILESPLVIVMYAQPYVEQRYNLKYKTLEHKPLSILQLPNDLNNIKDSIDKSNKNVSIQFINCTEKDLIEACKLNPKIFHFSGHSIYNKDNDKLQMQAEGNFGIAQEIDREQLKKIFKNGNVMIELIVLMSCYSEHLVKMLIDNELAQHVVYVEQKIENEAAKRFSKLFYEHIFQEKTICQAFADVKKQLLQEKQDEAENLRKKQKIELEKMNKQQKEEIKKMKQEKNVEIQKIQKQHKDAQKELEQYYNEEMKELQKGRMEYNKFKLKSLNDQSNYPIGPLFKGQMTIQRDFDYLKQSVLLSQALEIQLGREIFDVIQGLRDNKIVWAQINSVNQNEDQWKLIGSINYSLDWSLNIQMSVWIEEQYKKYDKEFEVIRLQVVGLLYYSDWVNYVYNQLKQDQVGDQNKERFIIQQLKDRKQKVLFIIAQSQTYLNNYFTKYLEEFLINIVTPNAQNVKALVIISVKEDYEKKYQYENQNLKVLLFRKPKKPKEMIIDICFQQIAGNQELRGYQPNWFMQVNQFIDPQVFFQCSGHDLECINNEEKQFVFECLQCLLEFQIRYFCTIENQEVEFEPKSNKVNILSLKRCYKCGFHQSQSNRFCKMCEYNFEKCSCCDCTPLHFYQSDYAIIPQQPIFNKKNWQTSEINRGLEFYYTQRCSGVEIRRNSSRYPSKRTDFDWDNYIVGVRDYLKCKYEYQFIMSAGDVQPSRLSKKEEFKDFQISQQIQKVHIRYDKRDAKLCGLKFWAQGNENPFVVVGECLKQGEDQIYGLMELQLEQGERLIGARACLRDLKKAQYYSLQFIVGRRITN